jgi:hypothetical protein
MFDLVMNSPEAESVFTAAAEVLGQDPRRFVREAAAADLFSRGRRSARRGRDAP